MPVNYASIRLAGLSERMVGWAALMANALPEPELAKLSTVQREKYESERRRAKVMFEAAEEFVAWEQAALPDEPQGVYTRRLHGRGKRRSRAPFKGKLGRHGGCMTPDCPRAAWRSGQCAQCYESAKMIHAVRTERERRARGVA